MRNTIADVSGKPMVMLGGPHMYKQRVTGDVVSEYTWINEEPHMILYRAIPSTKVGAYLIDMRDAHRYATSQGGPSKSLFLDCIEAAKAMGFNEMDSFAVKRIQDIILDGLEDLVKMPPEPKASQLANAPTTGNNELTIKSDGKTIIEALV